MTARSTVLVPSLTVRVAVLGGPAVTGLNASEKVQEPLGMMVAPLQVSLATRNSMLDVPTPSAHR